MTVPAWVADAVVYGVIPGRFGPDGLRSVTERLPHLHDLGATALWLSPINASPPGDFGYAVTDYFALNPAVGTEADLTELVQAAHRLGIRVLMDFVPNHTSAQHPMFRDAEARGTASPYYSFYDRDAAGEPTHYFDWTHLPNLDFANPAVRRLVLDAFAYWVREFDVDGFRVDVAWGIKERAPDFWPLCRHELASVKPDVLLIAEAGARDPYYLANGFDAAYDWTDELGHWAWEDVFSPREGIAGRLRAALTNGDQGYPPGTRIFRFLNNNDTGVRFVDTHGPELTRAAFTLLLTLPGLPCLYTGDEVGASYQPYDEVFPIDWEHDPHGFRPFLQELIGLRRRLPSLHSLAWDLLDVEQSDRVLAYARHTGSDLATLIALNFSGEPVEAAVRLTGAFEGGVQLLNALGDDVVQVRRDRSVRVPLPAWGARILIPA